MGGSISGNSRTGRRNTLITPKRTSARLIMEASTGRLMLTRESVMSNLVRTSYPSGTRLRKLEVDLAGYSLAAGERVHQALSIENFSFVIGGTGSLRCPRHTRTSLRPTAFFRQRARRLVTQKKT